jgi:cardiolipin synthase
MMTATGSIAVPIVVVALVGAIFVVQLLFIWSIKRHRDPDLHIECDAPIDKLTPSLAGLSLGTAIDGNSVDVFENGAYFDALLEEIRSAKITVHFETFLWTEGVLGQRLAEALAERARAGLKVRVLLDATGTKKMGKGAERLLRDAGCRVVKFHDRSLRNIGVMNERDHRKLVVIDGRVAFVGGHCIVDSWLGDAEDKEHFGDVSARLRGPIVNSVQSAFSENWAGETGELFVGDDVFPTLDKAGDVTMHAAYVKPEGSAPAVKLLHHTIICLARKRIWIQNPYFIPEPEAIDAFGEAVKRGVDVRVMMPSTSGSDNPMVQHAGHRNFEKLLRCGVRLFEYPHTLLHQKVMTVDSTWCTIGSTNFDDRSFEINDEITLGIRDAATAKRLEEIFEKYAPRCQEIRLEHWRKRGVGHRLIDNMYYMINEVL